jgi:hypothetical protein
MQASKAVRNLRPTASAKKERDSEETAVLPALMPPDAEAANSAGLENQFSETLLESISRLIELVNGIDTKLERIATALEQEPAPKRQQRKKTTKRKTVRKKSKS